MAYTLGTVHAALAGVGTIALANPSGLKIAISGIPGSVGHDGHTPQTFYRLGSLLVGDVNGWHHRVLLEHAAQLVRPIPADCTLLAHDLVAGAVMVVTELVDVPTAPAGLAPWDRAAVPVLRIGNSSLNGSGGPTTQWTYTVPTGKKLWISHCSAMTHHTVASAPFTYAYCQVDVGGVQIVFAFEGRAGAAEAMRDVMGAATLVLPAGSVVSGSYVGAFTGGNVNFVTQMSGMVFDA